jgi:transcriptional regulator with XRE-family HTH domain
MYDKNTFANSLKSLLEKRGMTQRALAEKLGTTEVTVSRYTSGNRTPNVETTVAIAEVLGVSLDQLVGYEPPAAPRPSPDVTILLSCYAKASAADRNVLWSLMDRYMTTEQHIVIETMQKAEQAAAI